MVSCAVLAGPPRDTSPASLKFLPSLVRSGTTVTGQYCRAMFRTFTPAIQNFRPSSGSNRNIRTAAITSGDGQCSALSLPLIVDLTARPESYSHLFTNQLTELASRVTGRAIRTGGRVMNPRKIPTLPAIGALTLIYLAAGKLALQLAFVNASASPVWPPAGIALAALLVFGYRVWPAIFIGAFAVNFSTTLNILSSLGIAGGNTLEAICGAWPVNKFFGGARVFDVPQDVFKL